MDLVRVVKLEVDVLDDEGPDVVAEAVRVEVALEAETALNLFGQPVCDRLVEVEEYLHGKLGLDSALGDQAVERVREGAAETVLCQPVHSKSPPRVRMQYLLRR